MPRRKILSGVIDPITIIGVLFLIITLGVGTYAVSDKKFDFNIFEKAGAPNPADGEEGIDNWVNPNPVVTTNNNNQPINDDLEEEEVEHIQQVITAPVVINGQIVNPETPPSSTSQEPVIVPVPEPTPSSNTCDANGSDYPVGSNVIGGSGGGTSGYSTCTNSGWVDCPECSLTTLTVIPEYLHEQYNAAIQAQNYVGEVDNNLESEEAAFIQGVIQQEQKTQAAIQTQIYPTNNNPLANLQGSVGSGITPQQAPPPKFESKSECQANVNPDSREYNACGQFATQEETKTTLLSDLSTLFSNFNTQWSQAFGEGTMFDSDDYSFNLGGNAGSFAISPPPPSIMFSSNPQDRYDYYVGSLYAGGAGAVAATLTIPAFTAASIGLPATVLIGMNTLSAATPAISALTVGGLTIGAVDCAINGGDSALCQAAGTIAITGYTGDPTGFTQMFNQGLTVWTDTANVVSNIRRIPVVPNQTASELGSGDDVLNMVWDDTAQTFVMEGNTVSVASSSLNQMASETTMVENSLVTNGQLGFSEGYQFAPPNQTSVHLAELLDSYGINTAFPSVTANNLLGNPFPTTLDTGVINTTTDLANALDTPPTNTGGLFENIFSPQSVIPETGGGKFTFEIPKASQISDWIDNNISNPIKNLLLPSKNVDIAHQNDLNLAIKEKIGPYSVEGSPNYINKDTAQKIANENINLTIDGDRLAGQSASKTIVETPDGKYLIVEIQARQDISLEEYNKKFEEYTVSLENGDQMLANKGYLIAPVTNVEIGGKIYGVQKYIEGEVLRRANAEELLNQIAYKLRDDGLAMIDLYNGNLIQGVDGKITFIDNDQVVSYVSPEEFKAQIKIESENNPDDFFEKYKDRDLPVESVESSKDITTPQTNSPTWFQKNISEPLVKIQETLKNMFGGGK